MGGKEETEKREQQKNEGNIFFSQHGHMASGWERKGAQRTEPQTTCEEAAVATLVFLQQHLQQFGQNRALKPAVIIPRLYMKTANKK